MPPLHSALKQFSIRQQIFFGFLSVIILSVVMATFNIYQLGYFHSLFKQHQQISSDTKSMLEVDANIAQLQRLILAYATTDRAGDIVGIVALHDEISQQIAALIPQQKISRINSSHFQQKNQHLLKQLEAQVANLREKIEQLQEQRKTRDSIVSHTLFSSLEETDKQLHQLYEQVLQLRQQSAMQLLWSLQHHLATMQTHSAQYFNTHQFKDKQIIYNAVDSFKTGLSDLQQLAISDIAIKQSKHLFDSITAGEQLFHAAVQADRNYLFLINIVIAGESAEIAITSDELKYQFLQLEQEMDEALEHQHAISKQLTISASVAGALLAALFAFMMGKKVSEPLLSITKTFTQLVGGDDVTSIPGIERTDEVGQLANAANVFRENNKRTQSLLAQTERFADQLKQREMALEQAVVQAQDASLAKSQFLANMSHELRTPMNAILGMLALLKKTTLNTRQTDYTLKSETAARTLLSLLNDILDLSKAEAGKIELDPTPFNLDQLLVDLKVILAPLAAGKDIALNVEVAPELPRNFLGDTLRLQQILINLGSNAIKFTHHGSVTIAIHADTLNHSNSLLFSISDTGIGIAPENLEKIFTGFTQAEASTTRRYGGTGLGLAISQRLIALMGGQLRVDSDLGRGSCFQFSLKLPEAEAEDLYNERTQFGSVLDDKTRHLCGVHILLVEDNLTNQQIAQELLELEGAKVTTANHGQEAVDMLSRFARDSVPFDVVLMDIQMPVMDGYSATQAIRQTLQLHGLPIIAMTANAMASDREACLKAGMNDHIGKPFDISRLVKVLCLYVDCDRDHPKDLLEVVEVDVTEQSVSAPALDVEQDFCGGARKTDSRLDVHAAIKRMGGNQEIYQRMVLKFLQSMEALPDLLRAQLEQRDYLSLHKSFHSLKGVSGTFGFMALAETAAKAEKSLKDEVEYERASSIVNEVCELVAVSLHDFAALQRP